MDEKEFTALMRQYQPYVYTICCRFVQDAALAEDLTQETFLSAYLHREKCLRGSEKPWLARIAVNKAKDALRSSWKRRVLLAEDTCENGEAMLAAPDGLQPEAEADRREKEHSIRNAILALSPPYREVAVLVWLQQKTPDEAARLTGRPVKTIYTQMLRARKLLAAGLKGVMDG